MSSGIDLLTEAQNQTSTDAFSNAEMADDMAETMDSLKQSVNAFFLVTMGMIVFCWFHKDFVFDIHFCTLYPCMALQSKSPL